MNTPPTIRAARPEEAQVLTELALRSKAYWGYAPEFMEACREELTIGPDKIRDDVFHHYLAERDTDILGFYALEKLAPEGTFELDALFVAPEHIGQGVGRALIEHAKQVAARVGGRRLIIQGDPNAEAFYRAAGGEITGQRESGSVPGRFLPIFTIALG